MHASLHAAGLALGALMFAVPAMAEEELYPGDFVDRAAVPGVTHEILSLLWLDPGDDYVLHIRTTLAPGAEIPPSVFSDRWGSTVRSGQLTIGGRGPGEVLRPGDTRYATKDDAVAWANRGLLPTEVLSVAYVDADHDPITRVEAHPTFDDLFTGDVTRRFVVQGAWPFGMPYKVIVRDRSGLVQGARMATDRESGWARPSIDSTHDIGFAAGRGGDLLVAFYSFPCGPDAVIDVGEGLRAIKVIDRFDGGCDASAQRWDVILRLREPGSLEPEEILGDVVRP